MKKAILISAKPEWVEEILNGWKTLEIRKRMPTCDLPCKVYIYCSKGQELWGDGTGNTWHGIDENEDLYEVFELTPTLARLNGKVVAEFTLNTVDCLKSVRYTLHGTHYQYNEVSDEILRKSRLTQEQILDYTNGNDLYAWHIDDLKIYEQPKLLSDFQKDLDCDDYPCNKGQFCEYDYYDYSEGCKACGIDFDGAHCIYKEIKRPPQSYMYVEELI